MAHKLTTKKSGGEKPAPKKVPPKKATPKGAGSDRRTTSAKARPAPEAKPLPAATIRALEELEAGELTRYDDADDLFRKLGIKLGKA
jgi:hypothetical protein